MLAEAAHSWADSGNEIFLMTANRRSRRPPDAKHPIGSVKEAYLWSLVAALGLLAAGGAVSIMRGVQELLEPAAGGDFVVAYVVLAVSFLLKSVSFTQAEDAAALVGPVLAAAGLTASELTNSSTPDGIASILIGVLLGAVAIVLINLNRRFLVGEEVDPRVRGAVLRELLAMPEVARVTYLRLEVVGPRSVLIVGDVDLVGDDVESRLSVR